MNILALCLLSSYNKTEDVCSSCAQLVFFNRYASYAGQPSQNYGQSAQVRFVIVWLFNCLPDIL